MEAFNVCILCLKERLLSHKDGWQTDLICAVTASIQPPISILTCLRYFYECSYSNTSFPHDISGLPSFTCKTDIINISSQSTLNFCTALAYPVFVFTTKDRIRNNTEII